MRLLPLFLALAPSFGLAQDIETPSGPLRFVDSEVDGAPAQELWVGKTQVDIDTYAQFMWVEDKRGSLFLIGLAMGGNACPAAYAWVHTEVGNLHATPSFGTCSDLPDISHDGQTVTVTLPDMTGGTRTAFIYNGKTLREEPVGRALSGLPPGSDPAAWVGRYPFEILQAAEWEPVLTALMGKGGLAEARDAVSLSSPMAVEGDWVVGEGCEKITCDETFGAVALHRTDGRVLVAVKLLGQAPRLWGDDTDAPATILDILSR